MKTYQLSLTVWERIIIPTVLPESAKYEVGIVVRDLKAKLQLSQEEVEEIGLKTISVEGEKQRLEWQQAKAKVRTFALTQLEFEQIRGNLILMSEKEKLPTDVNWLAMFEKIMALKPSKS